MERAGSGEPPATTAQSEVRYVMWLTDGTVIDSSFRRAEPMLVRGADVMPGFREALGFLRPGAIARLEVPAGLAFGDRGLPGRIPGDATVLMWVELVASR